MDSIYNYGIRPQHTQTRLWLPTSLAVELSLLLCMERWRSWVRQYQHQRTVWLLHWCGGYFPHGPLGWRQGSCSSLKGEEARNRMAVWLQFCFRMCSPHCATHPSRYSGVHTCSNVISIKAVWGNSLGSEKLLQSKADGALSSSTQSSEPDAAASKTTSPPNHLTSLISCHMPCLECHIGGLNYILMECVAMGIQNSNKICKRQIYIAVILFRILCDLEDWRALSM